MRSLFFSILFIFSFSVFSQNELSPKETLILQKDALVKGKLSELWKMFPKSWRQKISGDFKSIVLEIPLEKRKDIIEILILLSNTVKDKEMLIAEVLTVNNAGLNLNEKENLASVRSFGKFLNLLVKSELVDQDNFSKFDFDKFIADKADGFAKEVINNPFFNALNKSENTMTILQAIQRLSESKIEGEGADLKVVIGDSPIDFKMKKIDGVWVPEIAEKFYLEYSKSMDETLVKMKDEKQISLIFGLVISSFKETIQKLRESRNLEELMTPKAEQRVVHDAIKREKVYQRTQAIVLGKALSREIKKKSKCLVIHHSVSKEHKRDIDDLVLSFKKGLGENVSELKAVPLKEVDFDDILAEAMEENTAEDFNRVLKANKGYDVVICMVPLPFSEDELYKMDLFKMIEDPEKPGFFIKDPKISYPIFGIYNGYIGNLESLFQENFIHAMTLWSPDPEIDDLPVPKDINKAFDKRYLTVTPDNIEEIKKKYPVLFPKQK